jgi:hypothetical protein
LIGTLGGIGELAREVLGKESEAPSLPAATTTPTVRRTRGSGDTGGA